MPMPRPARAGVTRTRATPSPRSTARHRPQPSSSAGMCGRPAMVARRPPTAMSRSVRTTPPAVSMVLPSASTIASRRRRSPALCACRRWNRLQRQRARLGPLRPVPGRRLRSSHGRTCLYHGGTGLWLAGRHDQPHRHGRRRRSAAGAVQRKCALGPCRGRLPLRYAVDRPHALCCGPGHPVQPAELFGVRGGRQQHLRAQLCRQGRDQHPHRARPARRQIIRRGRWPDDPARPRRLGA
ncbi:hypothetical protein ACVWXQ_006624 [Bradyrhizobium sp. S3.14.4]